MTGIEIAGQKIAKELIKLYQVSRNIQEEDSAEERKVTRKTIWDIQEKKRKATLARKREAINRTMSNIRTELAEQKDDLNIEQQIAKGAFYEEKRFRQ